MTNLGDVPLSTETRVIHGVRLPYRDVNKYTNEVRSEGEVFISLDTLEELLGQGVFDSQFDKVLLLNRREALALEAAGLAERETKGGYHRANEGHELSKLIDRLYREMERA